MLKTPSSPSILPAPPARHEIHAISHGPCICFWSIRFLADSENRNSVYRRIYRSLPMSFGNACSLYKSSNHHPDLLRYLRSYYHYRHWPTCHVLYYFGHPHYYHLRWGRSLSIRRWLLSLLQCSLHNSVQCPMSNLLRLPVLQLLGSWCYVQFFTQICPSVRIQWKFPNRFLARELVLQRNDPYRVQTNLRPGKSITHEQRVLLNQPYSSRITLRLTSPSYQLLLPTLKRAR